VHTREAQLETAVVRGIVGNQTSQGGQIWFTGPAPLAARCRDTTLPLVFTRSRIPPCNHSCRLETSHLLQAFRISSTFHSDL
jgi:hypothetical protein